MKEAAQQAANACTENIAVEEVDIVIEASGQAVSHAPTQGVDTEAAVDDAAKTV